MPGGYQILGALMARRLVISDDVKAVLRQWYSDAVLDDTLVLEGSFFGWLFGLSGQHAVTINKTVHLTKNARAEGTTGRTVLIGHELFHVVQQHDMGWWPFLLVGDPGAAGGGGPMQAPPTRFPSRPPTLGTAPPSADHLQLPPASMATLLLSTPVESAWPPSLI